MESRGSRDSPTKTDRKKNNSELLNFNLEENEFGMAVRNISNWQNGQNQAQCLCFKIMLKQRLKQRNDSRLLRVLNKSQNSLL